jgi:ribosomal protein L28
MAKVCELCQKGYLKANQVPRGIGRRVTRRTTVKQNPNLRTKKFVINGTSLTVKLCASCLKRMKMEPNYEELTKASVSAESVSAEASK